MKYQKANYSNIIWLIPKSNDPAPLSILQTKKHPRFCSAWFLLRSRTNPTDSREASSTFIYYSSHLLLKWLIVTALTVAIFCRHSLNVTQGWMSNAPSANLFIDGCCCQNNINMLLVYQGQNNCVSLRVSAILVSKQVSEGSEIVEWKENMH